MIIGVKHNPSRDPDFQVLRTWVGLLEAKGMAVLLDHQAALRLKRPDLAGLEDEDKPCHLISVLGGDGTILKMAQLGVQKKAPLLGINLGRLGFLAQVETAKMQEAVSRLASGDYFVESRPMLRADTEDGVAHRQYAVNDVVVARANQARIIHLAVYINDELLDHYVGDGVIIATPTGSTAYALSAGGPIVDPKVPCFVIAPICAHALRARTTVVPTDVHIRVVVEDRQGQASLSLDGREGYDLGAQAAVQVRRAQHEVSFIRFENSGFYDRLRSKLTQWNA